MWLSLVFFKGPKHFTISFLSLCLTVYYLELSSLGVGDMNCPHLRDLLPKLFCNIFLRTLKKEKMKKFEDFFLKRDKKQTNTLNKQKKKPKPRQKLYDFFFTRAKLRASVNPAAARSCLSSSVSLLSGNCEQIHKNAHAWLDTLDCLINSAFAYSNAPCIENKQSQLPGWLQCRCVGWCG